MHICKTLEDLSNNMRIFIIIIVTSISVVDEVYGQDSQGCPVVRLHLHVEQDAAVHHGSTS